MIFQERRLDKIDYLLVFSVFVVGLCGILTLYSQEANIENGLGRWYKQLFYFIIGLACMFLVARINYQLIGSYALPIYIFIIVLLIVTWLFGYLSSNRVVQSCLRIGFEVFIFYVQPIEFAKLSTIILLGQYLVLKEREIKNITVLLIPFTIVLIPMLLIIIQPDLGTALSFLPILFSMLFLGGADIFHIGSLIVFGGFSLIIPMYIEFMKLTLVDDLTNFLQREEKTELLSLVNKYGSKIWAILEQRKIGSSKETATIAPEKLRMLGEAVEQFVEEETNIFFRMLSSDSFMITVGSILVIFSLIMIILAVARGNHNFRKIYIPIGVIGISIFSALMVTKFIPFSENQVIRLTAFLNPEEFKRGAGYQLRASKPAIGSGRFFGKGLLNGEMTEGRIPHVPESGTDFIFTSWAEQTGFMGSVFLLFFLFLIPLRGLQISFESKDRYGSLLAAGIVALIFFHIFINIGIVMGLLPVTGLPLSFMSYGGSHMIMSMIAVGILISIKMRKHAN